MIAVVYVLASLCLFACDNRVLTHPYSGGNGHHQWSNPGAGMNAGHQQQQGHDGGSQQHGYHGGFPQMQGYNGGFPQMQGYNGGFPQMQGYNGGGNGFGQGGGGYSQNRGGQRWQSGGQGAEAYKTHVFNEPDRYGYDYTIPGATVHYLMYKKQGNRGSANYGGSVDNGWNKKY